MVVRIREGASYGQGAGLGFQRLRFNEAQEEAASMTLDNSQLTKCSRHLLSEVQLCLSLLLCTCT